MMSRSSAKKLVDAADHQRAVCSFLDSKCHHYDMPSSLIWFIDDALTVTTSPKKARIVRWSSASFIMISIPALTYFGIRVIRRLVKYEIMLLLRCLLISQAKL